MALDGELFEEALLDLDEEAERNAPPQRGVCDDEVRQPAGRGMRRGVFGGRGGDVVDVVIVVRVGKLLGRRVADLGQDEGGEGGGLRGCGRGVFAENGGMVRDARAGNL